MLVGNGLSFGGSDVLKVFFIFYFYFIFFIKKIFFNVYLFLRQRETEHEWGRVRERF